MARPKDSAHPPRRQEFVLWSILGVVVIAVGATFLYVLGERDKIVTVAAWPPWAHYLGFAIFCAVVVVGVSWRLRALCNEVWEEQSEAHGAAIEDLTAKHAAKLLRRIHGAGDGIRLAVVRKQWKPRDAEIQVHGWRLYAMHSLTTYFDESVASAFDGSFIPRTPLGPNPSWEALLTAMMDERLQNLSNIETRLQEQRLTPRAGISAAPQVVSQVALAAPATPDKLPATTSAAMAQARSPEENSKSEQTTMVASAQLDATHPGRNYVDLTPAELMAQIAAVNGTSAQKAAVARLYVGKWMRVEGVTRDVMVPADRRWAIVYFQGYERLTGGALVLGFDATWVDRVEHQPLEGRLIVHGQIGSAEDREVRLERCELGD